MSRLPYLRRDELDERGQGLWDTITSTRGAAVVNDEGGLVGPFNVWLHDGVHWHLELLPRNTRMAGLELGAGVWINAVPPEQAAADLRAAGTG